MNKIAAVLMLVALAGCKTEERTPRKPSQPAEVPTPVISAKVPPDTLVSTQRQWCVVTQAQFDSLEVGAAFAGCEWSKTFYQGN